MLWCLHFHTFPFSVIHIYAYYVNTLSLTVVFSLPENSTFSVKRFWLDFSCYRHIYIYTSLWGICMSNSRSKRKLIVGCFDREGLHQLQNIWYMNCSDTSERVCCRSMSLYHITYVYTYYICTPLCKPVHAANGIHTHSHESVQSNLVAYTRTYA